MLIFLYVLRKVQFFSLSMHQIVGLLRFLRLGEWLLGFYLLWFLVLREIVQNFRHLIVEGLRLNILSLSLRHEQKCGLFHRDVWHQRIVIKTLWCHYIRNGRGFTRIFRLGVLVDPRGARSSARCSTGRLQGIELITQKLDILFVLNIILIEIITLSHRFIKSELTLSQDSFWEFIIFHP